MVRIACHNRCQPTKWNPSRGHNFRVSIALLVGCCVVLNSCRVCSSNDSIIFYYYYLFLFLVTGCRHVTLYTFHALWCVCVYVVYDTRVYFIHWNPFHSLLDTQLLGTQLFEWLWKKTKNFRFKPLNWIRGQLDGGLHFSCNMNGFVFGFKQYVWTCQFGLHISLFIVWNQFSVGCSFDRRNRTSRTVAKKGSQISINWIVRTTHQLLRLSSDVGCSALQHWLTLSTVLCECVATSPRCVCSILRIQLCWIW